jgi:transcriptional regulator with XRE-family HTH domain
MPPTASKSIGGGSRNGDRRRTELADFLRRKRTSITPDDVGLHTGGRRRTPGLRREEVAQLAGIGTTWYTWLEQGRDVRASIDVFEALSRALRLSPAERTHLILLGRGEEAPPSKRPTERVSLTLRRLIESLGPNPAYVIGRRWDYLAWNRASCALFGDFGRIPSAARAITCGSCSWILAGASCSPTGSGVQDWLSPSSGRTVPGTSATHPSRS